MTLMTKIVTKREDARFTCNILNPCLLGQPSRMGHLFHSFPDDLFSGFVSGGGGGTTPPHHVDFLTTVGVKL
jgi:hypothetical protein